MLKSQQVRSLSPEMDPLRMGMGWTVDDLSKPQIMVESTYGNSHPGSGHLNIFVEEAVRGVNDHGGKAARYFATDMCDGMAQGHDGINYSLPSRDMIANMIEIHAKATPFDAGVFQKLPVVADGNYGAGVVAYRCRYYFYALDVQIVGGFVQNEQGPFPVFRQFPGRGFSQFRSYFYALGFSAVLSAIIRQQKERRIFSPPLSLLHGLFHTSWGKR